MFKGLEHTAIASPNPEVLANWYVANLGFHINFSYAGNFFVKAPNGSMLEIIPSEGERAAENKPSSMRSPGIRHLAIAVDNFDEEMATLRQRNVTFTGEPFSTQGNRLVFFADADGNLLHLISREKPLP